MSDPQQNGVLETGPCAASQVAFYLFENVGAGKHKPGLNIVLMVFLFKITRKLEILLLCLLDYLNEKDLYRI